MAEHMDIQLDLLFQTKKVSKRNLNQSTFYLLCILIFLVLDVEFSSQQYAITEGDGPVMIKLIGNPQQQLTTMFLVQTIQSPDSNEGLRIISVY